MGLQVNKEGLLEDQQFYRTILCIQAKYGTFLELISDQSSALVQLMHKTKPNYVHYSALIPHIYTLGELI